MGKKKHDLLIPMKSLEGAAECLKIIAHPSRLRMIEMMIRDRYMVSELAEACDIAPNLASEHLRLMQHAGLLSSERDGRRNYYRVAEPHLEDVIKCIKARYPS